MSGCPHGNWQTRTEALGGPAIIDEVVPDDAIWCHECQHVIPLSEALDALQRDVRLLEKAVSGLRQALGHGPVRPPHRAGGGL